MDITFDIPNVNIPWLHDKVKKLNKKAVKFGLDELKLYIGNPAAPITETSPDGFQYQIPTVTVRMLGTYPEVDGWHLSARLNRTANDKNIVAVVPGEPEPPVWVRDFYGCQHCGWKRYRKDVFVITNDKNEYKVVGRSCLKEFFNGMSPDALINWAKMIDVILETKDTSKNYLGAGRVPASVLTYPLEAVLMYTHAEIEVYGWVSAGAAWERHTYNATKLYVRGYIDNGVGSQDRRKYLYDEAQLRGIKLFTDDAKDEVKKAIEWAKGLAGIKAYEHNIKTLAENGYATWREIGMACSILPTYRRYESRSRQSVAPSLFLGIIGEGIDFDGKVVFTKQFATRFGVSTLVKFVTDNGNMVNWWASVVPPCQKNDTVNVKCKVKKHEEYKGMKQTTITHANVVVK